MLEVQRWLAEKPVESLSEELAISAKKHDTLPLMILNYSQTDSPKLHPVVRECRGLVLHSESHDVVARAFPRFFNLGECSEEHSQFQFEGCEATSKEDGSLLLLYKYDGKWRINSRNGFGDGQMEWSGKTWEQGFCEAMGIESLDGDEMERIGVSQFFTYVLEFCSPWNKIVRRYESPRCYLLAMYCGSTEVNPSEEAFQRFSRPERFQFENAEEVQKYLRQRTETDPTFEGVVLKDRSGMRIKVKSESYLRLHRIRGNNGSIVHPKHLLPFVLSGEEGELLAYFPEVLDEYLRIESIAGQAMDELWSLWETHREAESQKDFAMSVKNNPLASVLFTLRKKHGSEAGISQFKEVWRSSESLLLSKLF